jgi:hypothetical protein
MSKAGRAGPACPDDVPELFMVNKKHQPSNKSARQSHPMRVDAERVGPILKTGGEAGNRCKTGSGPE